MRITSIGGQPVTPPKYYEQMRSVFLRADSPDSVAAILKLGGAIQRNDQAEIAMIRGYLEPVFLASSGIVEYDVVRRRYNPLVRWRTQSFLEEIPLASLRYVGP